MSISVNLFAVYDEYYTNKNLRDSAMSVAEFDFSSASSHFPAIKP